MYRILYRFLASLARLTVRSGRSKDLEIIVLRHQLAVLRRQIDRPELTDADRSLLAAIAAAPARPSRTGWLVTPDTLLRWHRRRIVGHWTQPSDRRADHRRQRSFADSHCASQLRIRLGDIAASTANSPGSATALLRPRSGEILNNARIDPAPTRCKVTWSQFLRSQAAVACDFATIDTVTLRRFYLLFFIDIATRTVYFAPITDHPTGVWTTQAARNLLLRYGHQLADARALVRDRASQFIDAFDEIFRTEGCKILTTPVRTPVANAFAERWIGTLRRELLDRTIIRNQRQLKRLVVDYIDHYNTHRPHRSLDQRPPVATDAADQPDRHLQVVRTTRCGGLINEYRNAA